MIWGCFTLGKLSARKRAVSRQPLAQEEEGAFFSSSENPLRTGGLMTIRQLDPQGAYQLQAQEGYVYLDVRTVQEFAQGHAAGALNVPVFVQDPLTGQSVLNTDFIRVVETSLPKDRKLIVGCAVGQRSQSACEILAQRGYKDLVNIQGGFSGQQTPFGQVIVPGWLQLGLPIARDPDPEASYDALKARAVD
jgi:rhodanese-related sulfurtransferase